MHDVMGWIEASALGRIMRESGPWTYPLVNLSHILGVASLFGSVLVLDLRLLGLWRRVPLAAIADATVPVAVAGFALAATAGSGMLATNGTEYVGNPFLAIKFPAIACAGLNLLVLSRSRGWRARRQREPTHQENRRLAVMGGISLLCWLTAIAAGRLIAYW